MKESLVNECSIKDDNLNDKNFIEDKELCLSKIEDTINDGKQESKLLNNKIIIFIYIVFSI